MPEEGQDFIENDFGANLWLNFEFELLEEQPININYIPKVDMSMREYERNDIINKLIDAVQHLNKEIQSIKEK